MPIAQAMCAVYKLDCHNGVHQPGDDYRIALYTAAANLGGGTLAYSPDAEVKGCSSRRGRRRLDRR